MKFPRIFRRAGVEATILFMLVACASAYLTARTLNSDLRADYESKGVAISTSISSTSPELLFNHDSSRLQAIIDQFVDEKGGVSYVYIVDDSGEIISHTFVPTIPPEVLADSQTRKPKATSISDLPIKGRESYIDIATPILAGVAGFVHIGMNKNQIDVMVADQVRQQFLLIFGLYVAAITIAFARAQMLVKPLDQLAEWARTLGASGSAPVSEPVKRAIVERQDEIGELAREFMRMSAQIREREENLRAAGESAAERERQYRFMADSMPQIVWTARPDGNIEYYNQRWIDYTGMSIEQAKDWGWKTVLHPDDLENCMTLWRRALDAGSNYEVEYRFKRASDGTYRWHLGRAFAMRDAAGAILRWFGTCTDIHDYKLTQVALSQSNNHLEEKVRERTASLSLVNDKLNTEIEERRKTLEELKLAKEAAESANQTKSEFLANMSHELRTPLNGVIGMAELLINSKLTGRQQDFAVTVRRSAEALMTLLNDILDLSKIEAGKLTLEEIPIDLQTVVEEVGVLMSARATEKNLELIIRYAPDAPCRFIGDPLRIRQVLSNIVGNAVKFTSIGHVLIDVSCMSRSNGMATMRVCVEDTGIGITAEQTTRLFQKFSQCDTTTTRRFGGSGLGLAICKNIIELMNGDIKVSSNPGKSATFTITLSLPEAPLSDTPPPTLGDLQQLRFLIVDDNEINRKVLREQMTAWGLRHIAVDSGEAALQMLFKAVAMKDPFDLAVIDYQMPDMDGEMLAKAIKSNPAIDKTMLLMLTSMGHHFSRERLKSIGLQAMLHKPTRQSVLLETLTNLCAIYMGKRQAHSSSLDNIAAVATNGGPQPTARKLRVLMVEDNEVNRLVALGMLEHIGCDVEIAMDGREAVRHFNTSHFDAILMDCQMPEMDGFEATREIRRLEQLNKAKRRIPIIAMTANAMKGDRERCLDCGMDDYISKPFRLDTLSAALANIEDTFNPAPPASSRTLVDFDQALEIASGNAMRLKRIFAAFTSDAPKRLAALSAALAAKDAVTAEREVHSLKGAAANIAAEILRSHAADLECACQGGDLAKASELFQGLSTKVQGVLGEIATVKT